MKIMSDLKKEPRVCESCGGKFIPVRKDQRLCPDCRAGKHKYAAAKKPSDVEHYTLGETPEQAMPEPDGRENWLNKLWTILKKPHISFSIRKDIPISDGWSRRLCS